MTPGQFASFLARNFPTLEEAAEVLDLSRATLKIYRRGSRYKTGHPVEIPKTVELAALAIETYGAGQCLGGYDGGPIGKAKPPRHDHGGPERRGPGRPRATPPDWPA